MSARPWPPPLRRALARPDRRPRGRRTTRTSSFRIRFNRVPFQGPAPLLPSITCRKRCYPPVGAVPFASPWGPLVFQALADAATSRSADLARGVRRARAARHPSPAATRKARQVSASGFPHQSPCQHTPDSMRILSTDRHFDDVERIVRFGPAALARRRRAGG